MLPLAPLISLCREKNMSQEQLETVVIEPKIDETKACIIWMHGLGADGYDFVDIIPQLKLPENLGVKFIFPHAPIMPVTLNGGYEMRAWFDIYGLTAEAKQNKAGILKAQKHIETLIDNEIANGIPSDKIILAGFSQGAAMALHCGLRYKQQLGGILALSGFLLLDDQTEDINKSYKNLPILMMHGTHDDVVAISLAEKSKQVIEDLGFTVEWHTFPIQHSLCAEEITKIGSWLKKVLK